MPIYEYRCQSCGEVTEKIQSIGAPPLTICSDCGGELRKLISRSAFHLKGSGWYSDHYGLKSEKTVKKDGTTSSSESKADSKPAAATSDSGSAESKKADAPASKPSESKSVAA